MTGGFDLNRGQAVSITMKPSALAHNHCLQGRKTGHQSSVKSPGNKFLLLWLPAQSLPAPSPSMRLLGNFNVCEFIVSTVSSVFFRIASFLPDGHKTVFYLLFYTTYPWMETTLRKHLQKKKKNQISVWSCDHVSQNFSFCYQ